MHISLGTTHTATCRLHTRVPLWSVDQGPCWEEFIGLALLLLMARSAIKMEHIYKYISSGILFHTEILIGLEVPDLRLFLILTMSSFGHILVPKREI